MNAKLLHAEAVWFSSSLWPPGFESVQDEMHNQRIRKEEDPTDFRSRQAGPIDGLRLFFIAADNTKGGLLHLVPQREKKAIVDI